MPAHRADVPRRFPVLARHFAGAAGAVGAAIVIAVLGAGGTYALFSDSAPLSGGTLRAGTASLTINGQSQYTIPGFANAPLYPGRSVITQTPLTVANTGDTPLTVTRGTVTFANPAAEVSSHLVVAARQPVAGDCIPTPVNGTPGSFTSIRIEPGQSTQLCVEIQLKSTAPATVNGASATFTLPLNGVQVRP